MLKNMLHPQNRGLTLERATKIAEAMNLWNGVDKLDWVTPEALVGLKPIPQFNGGYEAYAVQFGDVTIVAVIGYNGEVHSVKHLCW